MKQKGYYPYEYMSDFEEFNKELPSKERFYSSLTNRKITDKTYEHVLNVWNKFEIKTMKDYHDLYLRCNALVLPMCLKRLNAKNLCGYVIYNFFPTSGFKSISLT